MFTVVFNRFIVSTEEEKPANDSDETHDNTYDYDVVVKDLIIKHQSKFPVKDRKAIHRNRTRSGLHDPKWFCNQINEALRSVLFCEPEQHQNTKNDCDECEFNSNFQYGKDKNDCDECPKVFKLYPLLKKFLLKFLLRCCMNRINLDRRYNIRDYHSWALNRFRTILEVGLSHYPEEIWFLFHMGNGSSLDRHNTFKLACLVFGRKKLSRWWMKLSDDAMLGRPLRQ